MKNPSEANRVFKGVIFGKEIMKMTMKTKVLILHTSVGYGIKVTAENIYEQLNRTGQYEVRIEDIQAIEKGRAVKVLVKIYSLILEFFPSLWGFLYSSNLVNFVTLPLRKFTASFRAKRTLAVLQSFRPAIVISTETIPTGIVSYLKAKGLYDGRLVMAFSDYHVHKFWLYDEVDLYLCNIAEQVAALEHIGIPRSKIAVVGATIAERFLEPVTKQQACLQLGLLISMPTVLVTSGSLVRMSTKDVFLRLLRSSKPFQVVVICGNNERLKAELKKISAPALHPVKILGYVNNMHLFMSAADVLVGKTGGPTMVEAVVKKLPLVLTDVRPGHEFLNLEYLLKNNIVEYGRFAGEAAFLVEQILAGKIKKDPGQAYNKIVRPKNSVTVSEALRTYQQA